MAPYDQVRHMLFAVGRDFKALVGMTDPDVFADEVFGFHAQQAVEKSLKAWLSLIDVESPSKHLLVVPMLHQRSVDDGLCGFIDPRPRGDLASAVAVQPGQRFYSMFSNTSLCWGT